MISSAVTALFNMVKHFFHMKATSNEHAAEISVVHDRKDLKRASNYAEEIIDLADKYKHWFKPSDLKKYEKLKKLFKRYN